MKLKQPLIGIVGGMGAFASLEFMDTIYKYNGPYRSDQYSPRVICVSETLVPDRTTSILSNSSNSIIGAVNNTINKLLCFDVDIIVIACITFHCYFDLLPIEIKKKSINLINIINNELEVNNKPGILLATLGTYKSGIINGKNVIIPSIEQQEKIHSFIYKIKSVGKNTDVLEELLIYITELQVELGSNLIIAGCTEVHIAVKYFKENNLLSDTIFIDPLFIVGSNIYNINKISS